MSDVPASDVPAPSGPDLARAPHRAGRAWWLALPPVLAGLAVLAGLGFAVPWWWEKGALVYVERLAAGFVLCL